MINFRMLLLYLLPSLGLISVNIIGQLYLHEVILALICVGSALRLIFWTPKLPELRRIYFFLVLWFFSLVATDLYRDTPANDFLRGWAKIIFFFISIYALSKLIRDDTDAIRWTIGSIIPFFVRPYQLFHENPDIYIMWKYGIGYAFLVLMTMPYFVKILRNPNDISAYKRIVYIYFLLVIISFFLNARSFAGICIFSGVLCWVYSKTRGKKLTRQSLLIGILTAFMLAQALAMFYSWGASSGRLGQEVLEKYEMQMGAGSGMISILLGGRSESLVSILVISENPILGRGSWAKDFYYVKLLAALRYEFTNGENLSSVLDDSEGIIPSHSYLLGAWVESGIFGGVFWVFILLYCFFVVLPAAWRNGGVLGLLVVMSLPSFFWNIMFSPFGANVRVDVASVLVMCCLVIKLSEQHRIK